MLLSDLVNYEIENNFTNNGLKFAARNILDEISSFNTLIDDDFNVVGNLIYNLEALMNLDLYIRDRDLEVYVDFNKNSYNRDFTVIIYDYNSNPYDNGEPVFTYDENQDLEEFAKNDLKSHALDIKLHFNILRFECKCTVDRFIYYENSENGDLELMEADPIYAYGGYIHLTDLIQSLVNAYNNTEKNTLFSLDNLTERLNKDWYGIL